MLSNPIFTILTLLGLTTLMTWFVCWLRAALRTKNYPECWSCGATKVRHSVSHRAFDLIARVLLLQPYRCRGCRVRFYGLVR